MPYCVNCGVELSDHADVCPLCQTPVWHPTGAPTGESWFPTRPPEVASVSRKGAALLITTILGSIALSCALLNVLMSTRFLWSPFVTGACMMLWVWFALPLLVKKMPAFLRLTLDIAAVCGYVWIASLRMKNRAWFPKLALPIFIAACIIVFVLLFSLRESRHSILTSTTLAVGSLGLFLLIVEYFCDRYFIGFWSPGWSLITGAVCLSIIIPLCVIRHVPFLREEIRRRFYF
jgi:hypothetical protein